MEDKLSDTKCHWGGLLFRGVCFIAGWDFPVWGQELRAELFCIPSWERNLTEGRGREYSKGRRKEAARLWTSRREGVCWGVGKPWLGYQLMGVSGRWEVWWELLGFL